MNQPILFDGFHPGAAMGEIVQTFEPELAQGWQAIFGTADAGGTAESAGIAVAMMMRGYLEVVQPRPPGNVHVRQRFTLHTPPRQGEAIRTEVICLSKELKRNRRHVELEVRGSGDHGRPIYAGILNLIWAA